MVALVTLLQGFQVQFQVVIRSLLADELSDTLLPGKATKLQLVTTVPQTDTGARDEYSKALERTLEKELGKLIP